MLLSRQVSAGSKTGAEKLNEEIAQRKLDEKATSDAAAQKVTDTAAKSETDFQGLKTNAYNDALASVTKEFTRQGVDPNAYMDDITTELKRDLGSIKDLDPNPAAAFPKDLGSTIINSVLGGKRTGALNTLNTTFTPNYANTALPDTLVDPYVSTLVNEQFDPLSTQLLNASKRGTLTPAGYNAALDTLNTKKSAAASTVRDLGTTILGKQRNELNDYISGARTDANALTLAGQFDPSSYVTGAQGKVAADTSGFGGALRSAVGDTQYATLGDLINAGGAVQGAQNPTANNPIGGAGYVPPPDDSATKRGLGSTGAF
jgi:hypothetical protein